MPRRCLDAESIVVEVLMGARVKDYEGHVEQLSKQRSSLVVVLGGGCGNVQILLQMVSKNFHIRHSISVFHILFDKVPQKKKARRPPQLEAASIA